jgi:dihydrofolate synthase/folylpolyglutamate synthase
MHEADLHHSNPSLQCKLEKIFQLRRTRSAVNWDYENYLDLLQYFGNPHKRLPPVVHVAGTNGKGSIIAMMRSICEAAGLRVHAYTSPHLIHVNERIVLAGQQIGDDLLESLIDRALEYVGDKPLSFFEIISVIAFKAFSDTSADILLLEVGMGGALDCTNVIDNPLVSIINRISMDHTMFLGNTIEEIAAQKAGIMKQGVPCVIGRQDQGEQGKAVLKVMQREAQQKDVPLFLSEQDFSVSYDAQNSERMRFIDAKGETEYPVPVLVGEHQIYNAAVVLMALRQMEAQGIEISEAAITQGLQSCQWPGRLQRVDNQWPGGAYGHEIWIDCGHNDSAGEALAKQLVHWNSLDQRQVFLVVGMLGAKDSKAFLAPLHESVSDIYVVPISSDTSSQSVECVQNALGDLINVKPQNNFEKAVEEIMDAAVSPVRILIAGSVYLAGDVLRFINAGESR